MNKGAKISNVGLAQEINKDQSFKSYIKDSLIKQIKTKPPVYQKVKKEHVDIANISFAYDNKIIMDLLKSRGNILAKGQFNKLEGIEKQI